MRTRHEGQLAERIEEIYRRLEHQSPPLGSFRRLWSIGELQLSLVANYLRDRVRRHFAKHSEAEKLTAEAHLEAALRILATMGYLRGLVMKVGQALSYYPGLVPQPVSSILSSLQFQAPPMHYSLVREQVIDELGGDPKDLFAHFEEKAFRAASLGQVHRATLKSGEEVVVKIQYPGIARTIESDLRNLRTILGSVKFFATWQTFDSLMDELVESCSREVDYLNEARNQAQAAVLFGSADGIRVPRVHEKFSSARILTTDYIEGLHLEDYLATDPTTDERIAFTEKLWRVTGRMILSGRQVYSDPHPGNFIFCPDGTLGLIDFGNVRQLSGPEFDQFLRGWLASLDGTPQEVLDSARELAGVDPPIQFVKAQEILILGVAEWLRQPFAYDRPFLIDRTVLQQLADVHQRSSEAASEAGGPPEMVRSVLHTTRASAGLTSILVSLDAPCNYYRIQQDEHRRAGISSRRIPCGGY